MGHFARLGLDTADQIQHNTGIILYRTGTMPAEAFEIEHVEQNLSRILPYLAAIKQVWKESITFYVKTVFCLCEKRFPPLRRKILVRTRRS
jgi:hypothetical protein